MKTKQILSLAAGILTGLAAAVLILSLLITTLGTSADTMLSVMRDTAPSESTGLPESAYEPVTRMICGYLSGSVETFQYELTAEDGTVTPLFNEKEQTHMADCRDLFTLCGTVTTAAVAVAAACMFVIYLLGEKRRAFKGLLIGCGIAVALGAALAIAAATNFNSVFIAFHRLFFTNDLWLMDRNTDLIIRLMPTAFFTRYALMIGGGWLGLMVLLSAGTVLDLKREK